MTEATQWHDRVQVALNVMKSSAIQLPSMWDSGPYAFAIAQRLAEVWAGNGELITEEHRGVLIAAGAILCAHAARQTEGDAEARALINRIWPGGLDGNRQVPQ